MALSPGASASAPPPTVLVCTERSSYRTGDAVNVTAYTLRGGVPSDARALDVSWGTNGSWWPVAMAWIETGAYAGSFVVNLTNPGWHEGSFQVAAQAAFPDGIDGNGIASLDLRPDHVLDVELTPSTYWLRPGDELSVGIHVIDGGAPRDATSLSVSAGIIGTFDVSYVDVPWTRIGTGAYEASYAVPGDLDSSWLQVSAWAETANATGSSSVPLSVVQPHPFDTWLHLGDAESGYVRFELFVSRDAAAVPGALVAFDYMGMGAFLGEPDRGSLAATTDEHGRASFNLSHSPGMGSALLLGNVTEGSDRQPFATFLSTQSPLPPGPPIAFEIRRSAPWDPIPPAGAAVLRYAAFHLGQPLARTRVEYAISSAASLLAYGSTETDEAGNFSLTTPVPAAAVHVAFFANLTGDWQSVNDFVYPEFALNMTADPLRPGTVSRVSGPQPAGPGPRALFTSLSSLDASGASVDWTWQPAILGTNLPDGIALGTTLVVNQSFPSFLPKGRDYIRSVWLRPLVPEAAGYLPWSPAWVFVDVVSIPNARPAARFTVSTTTPAAGEPVRINASGSSDEDGWVDAFQVDWGDGDWTNWGPTTTYAHAYRVGGDFVLTMHVRDDSGAYNASSVPIQVAPALLGVRLAVLLPIAGVLAVLAAVGAAWVVHRRRMRRAEPPPPPGQASSAEAPRPPSSPPSPRESPPRFGR